MILTGNNKVVTLGLYFYPQAAESLRNYTQLGELYIADADTMSHHSPHADE